MASPKIVGIGTNVLREHQRVYTAWRHSPKITPFSHPLGVAGTGKAPPEIAGIGHSILRDPTGTFNTVFILRIIPLNKRHSIK